MLTIHELEATFVAGDTAALLFVGSCSTSTNNNAAVIKFAGRLYSCKDSVESDTGKPAQPLQLHNRAQLSTI